MTGGVDGGSVGSRRRRRRRHFLVLLIAFRGGDAGDRVSAFGQ